MNPAKTKLKPDTVKRLRARRKWSGLLCERIRTVIDWPVGKPGRETAGASIKRACDRVRDLFGSRALRVISIATRRAIK